MENTQQAPQPAIMVLSQYIKDMSVELPLAPQIFTELNQTPNVQVDFGMKNQKLDDGNYEVALEVKMNADVNGKKLFIIELTYAAVAALNVEAEMLEAVLNIELPRLLFPFVRSIIANNLADCGLPPIMLSPIDFVGLYQAKKAKESQKAEGKKDKK
jgi:preprotein translocase subunit SecB